ncbi:MAG: gluconate 2-dehydrogenase subunit 3 family protein [Daejeonella sp.]
MNRREAVKRATFLLGGALTMSGFGALAEVLEPVSGSGVEAKSIESQEALIAAIADTIIPDTKDVPGAKAAGVGPFVVMMLQDCYTANVQKNFADGLMKVDEVSQSQYKRPFTALTLKEREEIFKLFKAEAIAQRKAGTATSNFFPLFYELTCLGYYTSEIGATKALRYVDIPGKYEACVPLKPGQKAWAT